MSLIKTKGPFEVFLIGDTGDISRSKPDPLLETLKAHFNPEEDSAVVFLGDNIYPRGLPDKKNILRKDAENTLKKYYETLKDYQGKLVFIAGNHDWNKGRKDGHEYVIRQEKYLQRLFEGRNIFLPSNGCPGPVEIKVNELLTIAALDTQWWMQRGFRPIGSRCGCRIETEEQFYDELRGILERNKEKFMLVIGHHPVYSYSIHGGSFKLKHHIFPLTIYDKDAWIPLPVIGSLLPLYRKFLGAREDMAHPRYRRLRRKLKQLFSEYPNLIYASGHEHNLQYIHKANNHFIVSGSGSKTKYVIQSGRNLKWGMKCKGFFKLRFQPDGAVFASAWSVDKTNHKVQGNLLFELQII